MSYVAMMVLFGLLVPIFGLVGKALNGGLTDEARLLQDIYTKKHPVLTLIGTTIGITPAIIYWVYVFSQL